MSKEDFYSMIAYNSGAVAGLMGSSMFLEDWLINGLAAIASGSVAFILERAINGGEQSG